MLRLALFSLALGLVPSATAQTCTTEWTDAAGGDWTDAGKWSSGVPGVGDDACITLAGTYTVTLTGGGTVTLNSLTVGGASGTQTLRSTRNLALASGGTVGANGVWQWQNGVLSGGATLANDGLMVIDGSPIGASRAISGLGTVVANAGTVRWESDDLYVSDDGALVNTGAIVADNVAGSTPALYAGGGDTGSRRFLNSGSIAVDSGTLIIQAKSRHENATFTVADGAEIRLQTRLNTFAGTATGTPVGDLRLETDFAAEPGAAWNVGGSGVQWQRGFLVGGETLTNTATTVLNGSPIGFARGVSDPGSVFANAGTLRWESDEVYLRDDGALGNSGTITASLADGGNPMGMYRIGTDTGSRRLLNTGAIDVQLGVLDLEVDARHEDATLTAAAGATLQLDAGVHTFAGTMTGAPAGGVWVRTEFSAEAGAIWNVTGEGVQWRAGFFTGGETLTNTGIVAITGAPIGIARGVSDLGTVFANAGTVRWGSDDLYLRDDGAFDNSGSITASLVDGGNPMGMYRTGADTGSRRLLNTGTIDVQLGVLDLEVDARHEDATLTAADGATLQMDAGVHTFAGTTTGAPTGNVWLRTDVAAEAGAVWNVTGEGIQWRVGFLTGGQTLTNAGTIVWNGAPIGISRGIRDLGTRLDNTGTVVWVSDDVYLRDDGAFESSGDLIVRQDGSVPYFGPAGADTGSRNALISGLIDVEVGTLDIHVDTRYVGASVAVAAGASLQLDQGVHTFDDVFSGTPVGDVLLSTTVVVNPGAFWDLGGAGLQWQSGFLTGGETLTNEGLLVINGAPIGAVRGVEGLGTVLVNGDIGTVRFETDDLYLRDDGAIRNEGMMRVAYTGDGTLPWLGANGADTGSRVFTNTGSLLVDSATLFDVNVTFVHADGAVIGGTGAIDMGGATLTHDGDTAPGTSPGLLTWNGSDWAPSASAALQIEIGGAVAGTDYDQLAVATTATLAGSLDLAIADGFAPSAGDSYTVLTASAVSGTFDTITGPPGWVFDVAVNPADVVVTVLAVGVTAELTGAEGWRMLASSVTGQTYDGVVGALWTQGFTGADVETGPPNVFVYDETVPGGQSMGYAPIGDQGDPFPLGTGAFVHVFADDDGPDGPEPASFPKTIVQSGTDATGAQSIPVSYADSGALADDGWTLAGNPYAASMDWADAAWTRTNVSNSVYVWDPGDADYRTHNTVMGSLTDGLVAPGQGMWVQATGAAPALVAPASSRTTGGAFVGRTVPEGIAELRLEDAARGIRASAFVGFDARAADGADAFDTYELTPASGDAVALWTDRSAGGTPLDIQMLAPADGARLALGVAAWQGGVPATADLVLRWPALPDGWAAELHDAHTGEIVDMTQTESYAFQATAGSARVAEDARAAIQEHAGERFTLVLGSAVLVADAPEPAFMTELLAPRPNPTRSVSRVAFTLAEAGAVRLSVVDLLGREVAVLADGDRAAGAHEAALDTARLASGVYVVRLQTGDTVASQRLTVVR